MWVGGYRDGRGQDSTLWRPMVIEIRGGSGTGGNRRRDNQFEAESET